MAEASKRAAEGVLRKYALLAFLAIAGPAAAWVGANVVTLLAKLVDDTATMKTDIAVMKNDIGYLKEKVRP